MGRLTTEYCVEIRVPKKNSDKNKFGTGYTLGPHWVLTAYHVLFGDDVDASQPLQIIWWDETEEAMKGGEPVSVSRENIVWQHKEHDIALIRCEKIPYKDVPTAWALIGMKRPTKKKPCDCAGFLSNLHNSKGNQRRQTPSGELGLFSSEAKEVHINVNVALKKDKYWAGFSGSPVFVDGKFEAVVRTVRTKENKAGLIASFISAALYTKGEGPDQPVLRDVPGFLIAPDRQKCWERIREQVIKTIQAAPNVYNALKKDYLNRINPQQDINNAEELVERLYYAPNIQVISSFLRVVLALRDQGQRGDVLIMKDLACVWLALLAADQGNVCEVEAFKNNTSDYSLELQAVEPVLLDVEAQAANAENRSLHLHLVGESLRSPFDLTPSPRGGFDVDDRQAAKDTADKYLRKTRPGFPGFEIFDLDEAKDALEEFATGPETGLSRPLCPDNDLQRGLEIGDQLEWACAELQEKVSYYIRLPEPVRQDSCLHALHTWCPQLLVFAVSVADSRERKRCLSGLHRIIHHAETFLNEHFEE